MKKLIVFFIAASSLAGCAALNTQAPSLKTVYEIRASYDAAFLAPAANYRKLGLCASGTKSSLKAPCADPAIVRKLQVADQQVEMALDNVEIFTRAHPGDLGVNGLYDAAILAITEAEQLAVASGIK